MKPSQKIFFADQLTRAVDLVRIAKREVSELNGKSDPEKELYCYSAIYKAEAVIERCNTFFQKYKRELIVNNDEN